MILSATNSLNCYIYIYCLTTFNPLIFSCSITAGPVVSSFSLRTVLSSSAVELQLQGVAGRGFESRPRHRRTYKIGTAEVPGVALENQKVSTDRLFSHILIAIDFIGNEEPTVNNKGCKS